MVSVVYFASKTSQRHREHGEDFGFADFWGKAIQGEKRRLLDLKGIDAGGAESVNGLSGNFDIRDRRQEVTGSESATRFRISLSS